VSLMNFRTSDESLNRGLDIVRKLQRP